MRRLIPLLFRCLSSVAVLFFSVLAGSAASQGSPARLDSSDWWSYTRQEELPIREPREPVRFQNREPAEANFRIAGVTLGTPRDFSAIRSNFGSGAEVERGDAASSRNQICYVSTSTDAHLIFEFGEIESAMYLFQGGPPWNGGELCAPSDKVSANSSTLSGLKLGVGPREVEAILGEPSNATPKQLVYYFEYRKKITPEALVRLRESNPDMSDAELAKNFEYADGEVYIEARFASGKLNYLAISRSETY
jgi:hypothetical protein